MQDLCLTFNEFIFWIIKHLLKMTQPIPRFDF